MRREIHFLLPKQAIKSIMNHLVCFIAECQVVNGTGENFLQWTKSLLFHDRVGNGVFKGVGNDLGRLLLIDVGLRLSLGLACLKEERS